MTNASQESSFKSCLHAVWRRKQRKHVIAGLLAMLRWGIPLFFIGMTIDRFAYLPGAGRAVVLLILLGVSFYMAWKHGWRKLRRFDATQAALDIETQHGGLESLLVTAVQFENTDAGSGASKSLLEVTRQKAESASKEVEPAKVINFRALRIPLRIAMGLAVLVVIFAVLRGPFLAAGLTRIFTPWSSIAYPTKTKLDLGSGDLVVKEGDRAQILIGVSGEVPDKAKLFLRTGEGSPREIELEVIDGRCEYAIAAASRDFSFRIKAGDARSDWYEVRVINAPRIENVRVGLKFPTYLERADESVEALTLTVPQDTRLRWDLTLDRPIREAVLNRDGKEPLPLKVINGGRQVVIEEEVEASRGYSFSWVEKEYGFDFTSPRYYLQVASDQAPRVELTSPESNLVGMIGRPLSLTVRAQDDYGIGSAAVAYRVNQRDEKKIEIDLSSQSGQGEQPIDWDYREEMPDLKIGDSVAFTLEVSDRYPGEGGPHVVRSETRRLTFLSKEDYLEQIQKKKDGLLSRVQTAYRQQRTAFESVRSLKPTADNYMQACQIEAIRQELVRDQLKGIAEQLQDLLDDLAANKVADAPEGESLEGIRAALLGIADTHLVKAASRLRHQSGVAGGDTEESPDPSFAARAVNTAARELGSLVLLRSIDTAQEVYARESRMLAQVQASLRWRAVQNKSPDARVSLAKEQEELAQWTQGLITDLRNGMRFDKRPLAVLRLIQSVKDLQRAKTEERIHQAAELIMQGQADQAEALQAGVVTTLLDAEFSVRLSGAYSTLIKTRDEMRSLVNSQALLREQCADMSADSFKTGGGRVVQAQTKLRERLLTLLLQTVPAPRTQLFDESWPEAPPVQALLKGTDRAMADAIEKLTAGQKEAGISQQLEAEKSLAHLAGLVDRWSVELGLQTLGLSTLVAVTGERLALIEGYEAQVIALLEKTDIAAADEKKVDGLAETQLLLAEELSVFNSDLAKQNRLTPDQDIPPLLSRMERAEKALRNAVASLGENDADQAIGYQEQAADILAEAYAIVTKQNEQLGLLQSLLMFQRSVGFATGYMGDIVAEQRDMIAATKALQSDEASHLFPPINNLRRCMNDVAPLLDLVAARVDAGSPLAFAVTDLEDAVAALEDGDKLDSLDAQEVAAESLEAVNELVKAVKSETGYVSEIVEFLHVAVADTAMLEYQQDELVRKVRAATPAQLKALATQQRELFAKAEKGGRLHASVSGISTYAEPARIMRDASALLDSNDVPAAIEQMELAGAALTENGESLYAVITMLHGLPSIEIMSFTDPDVQRLVDVLAVASAHKILFRDANKADAQTMKALAVQQEKLAARCLELFKVGEPHAMLGSASWQLLAAANALKSSDLAGIKRHQKAAMQTLRHFIIEQALILETAVPPATAQDADPAADGEGSDGESDFAAGFIADFVSGEAPKDQRTGWKVRGDRNRAALNQNFARELPLEYRGLLQNYYERVAK